MSETPEEYGSPDKGLKELMASLEVSPSLKAKSGRPYLALAKKAERVVYANLDYGPGAVQVKKKQGLVSLFLIVRFRGAGKGMPVPQREGEGDATLLKKYVIPLMPAPTNGVAIHALLEDTRILFKVYGWIKQRMESKGWSMSMTEEQFVLYGEAPFEYAKDMPSDLFPHTLPEW